jgi:hypothetical protein
MLGKSTKTQDGRCYGLGFKPVAFRIQIYIVTTTLTRPVTVFISMGLQRVDSSHASKLDYIRKIELRNTNEISQRFSTQRLADNSALS